MYEKKISMIELLEKFKECDVFSLTGSVEGVAITKEDKNKAIEEVKKEEKEYLLKHYNKLKEEYSFIPFDELYNEIEKECETFKNEKEEIYMKKDGFFGVSYICDQVGKNTKYSNPHWYFWHFYHKVGNNFDRDLYVDKLINMNNKLSAVDKIEDNILKSNLIRYEISFYNHCSISGGLMINYYFKLNEDTKKWLLQFESDFDLEELDDLAFYKDGEILFSSCTSDLFNSLLD